MSTRNHGFTNFPYGPVALSESWKALRESGIPEAPRIPLFEGGATTKEEKRQEENSFVLEPGYVIPHPIRLSERSERELTGPFSMASNASNMYSILSDRLYLMTMPDPSHGQSSYRRTQPMRVDPSPRSCYYYFTTEKSLRYYPFSEDFGPLNLGLTVRFITRLHKIISNPEHSRCRIVYYCPNRPDRISNAVTLLSLYLLCEAKLQPSAILDIMKNIPFKNYRDASYGGCNYFMTLEDILGGVQHAMSLRWFDWRTFPLQEYEKYECIDQGDLNWIIPGKFVAFSSPMMRRKDDEGYLSSTPDDYVPIFKSLGVTDIVRLNDNVYDRTIFLRNGFEHHDLTYPDGSIPNEARINEFLAIAEKSKGAVGIHCKAGLGRTGSMMGCYAIRHYNFTGRHWVAWNRICRPGSVLGPQQMWLSMYEAKFKKSGELPSVLDTVYSLEEAYSPRGRGGVRSPMEPGGAPANLTEQPTSFAPPASSFVVTDVMDFGNQEQNMIAVEGDKGQAERLRAARRGGTVKTGAIDGKASKQTDKFY